MAHSTGRRPPCPRKRRPQPTWHRRTTAQPALTQRCPRTTAAATNPTRTHTSPPLTSPHQKPSAPRKTHRRGAQPTHVHPFQGHRRPGPPKPAPSSEQGKQTPCPAWVLPLSTPTGPAANDHPRPGPRPRPWTTTNTTPQDVNHQGP